jgi:exopolyphosphatase/guanosine-5'-triphosphate,3'-diphosphate pyrophosphatase
MARNLLGVIDIGTLKVKLLIEELAADGSLKTKYQSNNLTCLGVRMHENNNQPKPEYLQATFDELKRCKAVLKKEGVSKIRVVSTHALREMGGVGEEIAQKVKKKVGLRVEIISQKEEAELFFQAVIRDFETDEDFTIIDVGGGSVQLLIGNKKKLKNMFLLRSGAQYLFDIYSPHHQSTDFPKRSEIRKMDKYIMEQLSPIPKDIKTPVIYGSTCIIDLFKTLGLTLEDYQFSKTHPYKTQIGELTTFLRKIIPVPYDKREEIYHFSQKDYMWGIDKAFLNVINICKTVEAPFVIPSNANINLGLILSLLK